MQEKLTEGGDARVRQGMLGCVKWCEKAIACSVLPSPISSARMPLMPFRYASRSQLSPPT